MSDKRKWVLVECLKCGEGFWVFAKWSDPPERCHECGGD